MSCIYADQWNQSSQVDGPISGFVDAKQGAGDILATFRPGSRLLTWQSIAAQLSESEQPTIVYPKHHERALLKQLEPLPSALRSQLNALALPEPPDYVIEWQRFNGDFEEAAKLTEGYDSTLPTEHLIQSTLRLAHSQEHQLTGAQQRQVQLIEAFSWASITGHRLWRSCGRKFSYFTDCPKVPDRILDGPRDPQSRRAIAHGLPRIRSATLRDRY